MFIAIGLAPLFMTGGLAGVGANILGSFVYMGIGYITMGIGILTKSENLVLAGALAATGGVVAVAATFKIVSALFASVSGRISLPLASALAAIIKADIF